MPIETDTTNASTMDGRDDSGPAREIADQPRQADADERCPHKPPVREMSVVSTRNWRTTSRLARADRAADADLRCAP